MAIKFSKYTGSFRVKAPLHKSEKDRLKNSNLVSPIVHDEPSVVIDCKDYPAPPSEDYMPEVFWNELRELLNYRRKRLNGEMASQFMEISSVFDKEITIDEAAQSVRADFPTAFPTRMAEILLKNGAKFNTKLFKTATKAQFSNVVLLGDIIGTAVNMVHPNCFAMKHYHFRARPEEYVWEIYNDRLDAPEDIKKEIKGYNLKRAEDFTAYIEGCPRHGSFPQMHGAAISVAMILGLFLELTEEQKKDTFNLTRNVARYRDLAGVHFRSDIIGVEIGEDVLIKMLPAYLSRYGCNPVAIEDKLKELKYDWRQEAFPKKYNL